MHNEEIERLYAETQRLTREWRGRAESMPATEGTPQSNAAWLTFARAEVEYFDQLAALWATIARLAHAADDVPDWAAFAATGERYHNEDRAEYWRSEARKRARQREQDIASGVFVEDSGDEIDRIGELEIAVQEERLAATVETLRRDGWEGSAIR